MFFSPFSIAITSLGEKRANLSAFRTFVRFVLLWICRFPLPLGVWEGLRFVIVALPGLFSYFFCLFHGTCTSNSMSFILRWLVHFKIIFKGISRFIFLTASAVTIKRKTCVTSIEKKMKTVVIRGRKLRAWKEFTCGCRNEKKLIEL